MSSIAPPQNAAAEGTQCSMAPEDPMGPSIVSVPASPESDGAARYKRQLQAITDVAWSIHSADGIDAMLARILAHVSELIHADRCTFYMVDRERGQLWSRVMLGSEPTEIRLELGAGIAGHVAMTGQRLILQDAYDDPRFDPSWDRASGYRTRALLCEPIVDRDGATVAVLQCLNKGPDGQASFEDADADLLSLVGAQCAVALEKARLYDVLKQRNAALQRAEVELRAVNEELALSYEVERHIAEAPDEEALLGTLLFRVRELFHAGGVGLLSLRDDSGEWLVAAAGQSAMTRYAVGSADVEGWFTHCRRNRNVDLGEPGQSLVVPEAPGLRARTAHAVLLSDEGRPFAVLQLFDPRAAFGSDRLQQRFERVAMRIARGLLRLRQRAESERAGRLSVLGHSLSALLHDLRSPMAAVSGYVELLALSEDAAERADFVRRIERALAHIERMTEEVLTFARGQREVLVARVYLDGFVRDVRELLEAETVTGGMELAVDVRYDGVARFDASKLTRVVLNLARNACQAMTPGGVFTWRIDADVHHVVFECEDTGPGIAPEIEGRLFESFASHGKAGGTGLGLAMAKRIVEAHDGTIECVRRPGHGALFRIQLPR